MEIKKAKKNYKLWIFPLVVFCFYFLLLVIHFSLFRKSLFVLFDLIWRITPVFILVYIFMFLIDLFVDMRRIVKIFGQKAGLTAWFIAVAGGILSSGPIYAWYPMLKSLREKGMGNRFIVAFLYNRAVKVPLLPMMIYYFGINLTIILSFYMILFSIINGIVVEKLVGAK